MKKSLKRVLTVFMAAICILSSVQVIASASIVDCNAVKICLIGNSYLAYGDFGEKLERIAESKGHDVKIIDLTKGANEGMITNQLKLLKTERGRLKKLQSADIVILQLRVGFKLSEYEELLSYLDDGVKVYATGEPTAYLSCLSNDQMKSYWDEWKKPVNAMDPFSMLCRQMEPIGRVANKIYYAYDNDFYKSCVEIPLNLVYKYIGFMNCTGEFMSYSLFNFAQTEKNITDFEGLMAWLESMSYQYGYIGYFSTPELWFRTLDRIDAFIPNGYIFDKLITEYDYSFFDIRRNDDSAHATDFSAYAFALAAYSILFVDSPLGVDAFLTNYEYRQLPTFGIRSRHSKDEVRQNIQVQVDVILKDYNQKAQQLTDSIEFNSEKGFYVKKADSVLTYVY